MACCPALWTVDDSLSAVWQGLLVGESAAAVAGGTNVMLTPQTSARICLLQALSPVGRCKTFDATGDGYGRGEAFTVAYLRSPAPSTCMAVQSLTHLPACTWNMVRVHVPAQAPSLDGGSSSQRAKQGLRWSWGNICRSASPRRSSSAGALLNSSAVNQDGRSSSLTAPNGPLQQVTHSAKISL